MGAFPFRRVAVDRPDDESEPDDADKEHRQGDGRGAGQRVARDAREAVGPQEPEHESGQQQKDHYCEQLVPAAMQGPLCGGANSQAPTRNSVKITSSTAPVRGSQCLSRSRATNGTTITATCSRG